jgi:hypothetical protein
MIFLLLANVQLAAIGHAAEFGEVPNFSGYWERPEAGSGRQFYQPESGPGPIRDTDPQDNFAIGDHTDPLLLPHAAEAVKAHGDRGRAGEVVFPPWSECWPTGLPLALILAEPVQILQEENQVTILYQRGMNIRRIYLDAPHPTDLHPEWYGHSIGHYEGDTLVVDTVAQDTRSNSDRFGTPKSPAMRVVERYRLSLDGRRLHVDIMVEDRGTYTAPWRSYMEYVWPSERNGGDPADAEFIEMACAENNRDALGVEFAIPIDNGPPAF